MGLTCEFGPPKMSTAAEFVAQRPPQPCSVDNAPRTKQLGNRLSITENVGLTAIISSSSARR
jgi:hypothetical protein